MKDYRLLIVSIVLFTAFFILNFPYPHAVPFGEVIFTALNLPVSINSYVALLLFVVSMILLVKALNKFKGRAVIIAILIGFLLPYLLADFYQKTLATDIYSINYNPKTSSCDFEKTNDTTIHLHCELFFENYSNNDVPFTVEFYDPYQSKDDHPVLDLLNENSPFDVTLNGNEAKVIQIHEEIDVSNIKNSIEGGGSYRMPIIIKSKGKVRKL